MTYSGGTEEQIKYEIINICQDHIRKILETVRELYSMTYDFSLQKESAIIESHFIQIKKLKEEATDQKKNLLNELAEAGMLLINREDFLRMAVQINEIADICEGAAYRILYMVEKKINVKQSILELFSSISKNVLKAVTNLRETIFSLAYSRQRTIEVAKSVEIVEYIVDELYRQVEIEIIDSKFEVGITLILLDLAKLYEDIADKAEDAIDSTRVLALGI